MVKMDVSTVGTRGIELFRLGEGELLEKPGKVIGISADVKSTPIKRGEFYMVAFLRRNKDDLSVYTLFSGYVTNEFFGGLGFHEPNVGGQGFLSWRPVAEDIAPADITDSLAATNALRLVHGLVWYYHASSDVADRTMVVNYRTPGTALPTGITTGGTTTIHTFPYGGAITLSADQIGMIYLNDNFLMSADNSSRTFDNTSIKETGFPVWIHEDDLAELLFNVTLEEAADRHSIYILQEEWMSA